MLTLNYYPARLSDDQLALLHFLAVRMLDCSPRLGLAMEQLATTEQLRRLDAALGSVREVEMLEFDPWTWSDAALAAGLHGAAALILAVQEPAFRADPELRAFAGKLLSAVAAAAKRRLLDKSGGGSV